MPSLRTLHSEYMYINTSYNLIGYTRSCIYIGILYYYNNIIITICGRTLIRYHTCVTSRNTCTTTCDTGDLCNSVVPRGRSLPDPYPMTSPSGVTSRDSNNNNNGKDDNEQKWNTKWDIERTSSHGSRVTCFSCYHYVIGTLFVATCRHLTDVL